MNWMEKAEDLLPQMIEWRRHLHQYPEIGFHEVKTAEYVAGILQDFDLEVHRGLGGTGIIGVLEGRKKGRIVGIRSELDALPIEEANDISYKSKSCGVMHACGHDGHMALTLGSASLLADYRDVLEGTVLFIFQPAEELLPNGGAKVLFREGQGLLGNMDCILGCHLWPLLKVGEVHIPDGLIMAAGDTFYIKMIGQSGHASTPHQAKDSIVAAAQTLVCIQQIVSRHLNPHDAAVVSVSSVKGGEGTNVLPEYVEMTGTTRYFKKELRTYLKNAMNNIVSGIAKACGCDYEFQYNNGYDPTVNDPVYAKLLRSIAVEFLGKENVFSNLLPGLVSEDFSYYMQHVPGCYFWLGCEKNNLPSSLHSSSFDFEERAMAVGAALMAGAAWSIINTKGEGLYDE